ncbi:MAG: TlpA disulfide reductase family protein [Thermoanaerobaculia bacterium]|nr:TlpA disulfide reductase family protein [Thermoanaerobaculia bacterium]
MAFSVLAGDSGRVELRDGLPSFAPLKRAYESGLHAEISPTATFVWAGRAETEKEKFWLLTRHDGGATLSELTLKKAGESLVGSLTLPGEKHDRSLHLRLDPETGILQYEWTLERSWVVHEGDVMPAVEAVRLDGSSYPFSKLRGKWVVINWWSVTCLPGREEIPQLNRLARERGGDAIAFVAVAPDDPKRIRRFLDKYPFDYIQTRGGADLIGIFGDRFPRHLIVDPDGVVRRTLTGGSSEIGQTLDAEIRQLRSSGP